MATLSSKAKSGYKTTEFYGHGFASLLGAVAATGFFSPDITNAVQGLSERTQEIVVIINTISDSAIQLLGIITAFVAQIKYGKGRAEAKKMPETVVIEKKS